MTVVIKVVVSDHAVVRYLERVDGPHPTNSKGRVDVEAIRGLILADGRRDLFALGAAAVKIGDLAFRAAPSKQDPSTRVVVTTVVDVERLDPTLGHVSNKSRRKSRDGRVRRNSHTRRPARGQAS